MSARYNNVSTRIDDATYKAMQAALGDKSRALWIAEAIAEKLRNDRQNDIDAAVRAAGF